MATQCSYDHSATSAKWKAVVYREVPSLPISQRYARIVRRTASDTVVVKPITRNDRVDSATALLPLSEQSETEEIDKTRFHKLPLQIQHTILQHALTEDVSIHPHQFPSESLPQQQALLPPLAHAVPTLTTEISIHLPSYFHADTFAFDLRTERGSTTFKTWVQALGPLSARIQSLQLTHWTTWWGFGHSSWTSHVDTTHFTREAGGHPKATRARSTPKNETCNCGVVQLLRLTDPSFDAARYRSIRSMPDFIACLRHPFQSKLPLPLTEVARLFAAMLDQSSQDLRAQYGRAGNLCPVCDMPRLYLCGRLSTAGGREDGLGVQFNALELTTGLVNRRSIMDL